MLTRRLVAFVAAIVAAFVWVGHAVPQIRRPERATLAAEQSPAALVAEGQRLFTGDRARCLTCHSLGPDPNARCPDQSDVGRRAATRRPGMAAAEYLIESLYDPNAFVVPGYPRDQMRPAHLPPLGLDHDQILALAAYLNQLGGTTDAAVVQQLRAAQTPWRLGQRTPGAAAVRWPVLPGDPARGRTLVERHGCTACHRIGAVGGRVGPDLSAVGALQGAGDVLRSILTPSAVIVKGYTAVKVAWRNPRRTVLQGLPVRWEPSADHPARLILTAWVGGKLDEQVVDLTEVQSVGASTLVLADAAATVYFGEVVDGDAATGVTFRRLGPDGWREEHFAPADIDALRPPLSPMPSNFAELLTPQEVYDVVAWLMTQTGTPR